MTSKPLFTSLGIHIVGALALAGATHFQAPGVAGAPGLSGSPTAGFLIELTAPSAVARSSESTPVRKAPRPKPVAQGVALAAELPQELPSETKADARLIEDEVQTSQSRPAAQENIPGTTEGARGQGGESDQFAAQVGNGRATNEVGLYLAHVHQRIQRNLRSPGVLEKKRTAEIRLLILASGHVEELALIRSTGDAKLDALALDAVKRAQPFDPSKRNYRVNLPVVFRTRL